MTFTASKLEEMIFRYYKTPGISRSASLEAEKKIRLLVDNLDTVQTELCYYIQTTQDLEEEDREKLVWILSTPFQRQALSQETSLTEGDSSLLIEIGPRLNFSTPMSTNAVSICKSVGLSKVTRIEASVRYLISLHGNRPSDDMEDRLVQCLHDRMTQCRYLKPVETFELDVQSEPVYDVDVIGSGRSALEKANKDLGLAFDDWDLDFYTDLFQNKVKRNPTSVECFDLAQSNSEHSRHWFFRGKLVIDGKEEDGSLFKMIMSTQEHTNNNNVIKFNDNSSGIRGYDVIVYKPSDPTEPSRMVEVNKETRHIIFTAETHNFPTGVAPFPGATTGTGGRIRDVHCTGRGAHVVAGTAGYCFGNLNIPGYVLPWEDSTYEYPTNFASPLEIAIEASNGASDYGNKFGEPVLAGFARSFGMEVTAGDRREYIKPIMFSAGIGQLEGSHVDKQVAEKGMEVAKVGGPVYRIGVGGGAASSVQVQGDNKSELDFGAVQRGDAEMEQKLNRLIRACVEMGKNNPIASIHDQGAGGNGNVLKEIVEPAGAIIRASDFQLGDPTISILELWGAEYQETNAILLAREHIPLLEKVGQRERCPVSCVGTVTGDGKICLEDFKRQTKKKCTEETGSAVKKQKLDNGTSLELNGDMNGHDNNRANQQTTNGHVTSETINGIPSDGHVINGAANGTRDVDESGDHRRYPVDLKLEHVLGKMPQKVFHLNHAQLPLQPMCVASELTVREVLERVLRLPAVASKRYLTNKVDRCVTGLVAQQQCVGPLHTPLADVAVTALSYMEKRGSATSIGEQPIKGLIDPACGARMSVGEALTNLVFAKVSDLRDVKCSGNWMWPAKLPGEGAGLVDACRAMCDVMGKLGIAVDGGKDSLSMAARVGDKTVKAPGTLVISAYVGCPDITQTVTPDLKTPGGKGSIMYVDIGGGKCRLGGTAFAQCFKQLGNQSPDLDHPEVLKSAFNVTQKLIEERKIVAGHDISDGGVITCLLEMAFAGNSGLSIDIASQNCTNIETLFHEELGLILEVDEADVQYVTEAYTADNISCNMIGHSVGGETNSMIEVKVNGTNVLSEMMVVLRDIWEETSFQLELRQANPECVSQEKEGLTSRKQPPYKLTFDPDIVHIVPQGKMCPRVAVLREEGSNSDREMSAALMMAGFEVWDVNMQDLCSGSITLDRFHGVVFVGGFSYADVLGSAKGWAATAMFNQSVRDQFAAFRQRADTFSLGVCNGCQLMGLLGWVSPDTDCSENETRQGVFLDHNDSERFECRFVTVKVYDSPAIMFRGMEDTVFGMWSAHGEGKMVFKNDSIYDNLRTNKLIPVRYVNDEGEATTVYPFNPNGSPDGVAALCSEDGRHLAIMPHPERCFLPWQCPWMPVEQRQTLDVSPWMKMFQNAFDWSIQVVNVSE
ncbi:phosphoribosylformylglycinamidine synthase-like isoform X2 [Mercenaria mercenaria]|uniref:phosphoribosylformylglycinamidine synthase-like isoform X2 n=1 Tax=Mercenaria mercenaria TaxID=6596 RepID=UPI00234F23BB|nr:phosphoribosylformylglycinamidine synthase-like isoform X2 [Mercenaria mercenaria]